MVGSYSPPFQWIDTGGNYRGLGADYDALIAGKLGTKVRAIPAASWAESLEQLQTGECDACTMIIHTPERERILNFSKEILVLPTVALVRDDRTDIRSPSDLNGKSVAVAKSWAIHEELERDQPGIHLQPGTGVNEALMAVSLGGADAYVGDLASASYAIRTLGITNLKVACMMPYTYSLRIGVRKDWAELVPILDQAIDAITEDEHEAIRNRWMSVKEEALTWEEILQVALPVAGLTGLVCLGIYIWRLRKEVLLRRAVEKELVETQNASIIALAALAETRDDDTGRHIHRTQCYVKLLGEELLRSGRRGITAEEISIYYKTAPLHDIGKVGIPDQILNKPGRLTPEEFEIMKTHSRLGAQALEKADRESDKGGPCLGVARDIALTHHEKWDGTGYPQGLKGEEIPLSGRLMSVADVYDALRSKRCYKEAMPHVQAVEIIRSERGRAFDPEIVDAFLHLEKEFERIAAENADVVERKAA